MIRNIILLISFHISTICNVDICYYSIEFNWKKNVFYFRRPCCEMGTGRIDTFCGIGPIPSRRSAACAYNVEKIILYIVITSSRTLLYRSILRIRFRFGYINIHLDHIIKTYRVIHQWLVVTNIVFSNNEFIKILIFK